MKRLAVFYACKLCRLIVRADSYNLNYTYGVPFICIECENR